MTTTLWKGTDKIIVEDADVPQWEAQGFGREVAPPAPAAPDQEKAVEEPKVIEEKPTAKVRTSRSRR